MQEIKLVQYDTVRNYIDEQQLNSYTADGYRLHQVVTNNVGLFCFVFTREKVEKLQSSTKTYKKS